MTQGIEINYDGLVGPTHNYGGLSLGNVASMASGGDISNPRAAALQGLQKMRTLLEMGLPQAVLPPHDRPQVTRLRAMGIGGTDAEVLEAAWKHSPALLINLSSASAMWTANAATVSPSPDTGDRRVHFTPANLNAMYHRATEPAFTGRLLQRLFADPDHFHHHEPIPGGGAMGDEGAANHGRLCETHGAEGIELFVYGRSAFEKDLSRRFLPRQALEASEAIVRGHGVAHPILLQQSQKAIDAGAFHNDVVAVANTTTLLYHEDAFENQDGAFEQTREIAASLGFEVNFLEVPAAAVPLEEAISSYLFNSQLVSVPEGGMVLILPQEAAETASTKDWVASAIAGNGPIVDAHFLDLKQSMKNGGGPACLRLRVALTPDEQKAAHQGVMMDAEKISLLENWVEEHYRDRLAPKDLSDPLLLQECREALDRLTDILDLGSLYDFQMA